MITSHYFEFFAVFAFMIQPTHWSLCSLTSSFPQLFSPTSYQSTHSRSPALDSVLILVHQPSIPSRRHTIGSAPLSPTENPLVPSFPACPGQSPWLSSSLMAYILTFLPCTQYTSSLARPPTQPPAYSMLYPQKGNVISEKHVTIPMDFTGHSQPRKPSARWHTHFSNLVNLRSLLSYSDR